MITYREARERTGLTVTMMAEKLGITKQAYHHKENYERQFKDNELMKFCLITKTKPSSLKIKGWNF